jgi:hypothetical protein
MRAAEALAEDARHSSTAAVDWVQALHQASFDTLKWAQAAQTVEALEAATAMEVAVEEAMQAVQHLLDAPAGGTAPTSGKAGEAPP